MKLLQYTALLYVIPFLESLKQPDPVFKYGLGLVIITSLLHHQRMSNQKLAARIRLIDMIVVHFMVAYHIYTAFKLHIYTTWPSLIMFAAILYSAIIYWVLGMCKARPTCDYWHSTIHITTALGSYALLHHISGMPK